MVTDVYLVTVFKFPILFSVLEMISHDNGGQAGHTNYAVSLHYQTSLKAIEEALSKLSKEGLETFAIGEESDMEKIAATDEMLQVANKMFYELL